MMEKRNTLVKKLMTICALGAVIHGTLPSYAVEIELPPSLEVQRFNPQAQQFYSAGVNALDRADYLNGYAMLAKAAAFQPESVQLNRIAASLAVYHGRQATAENARDYYETATTCYENILSIPTISAELRRQVTNELKIAEGERDNLAQRDVMREATGTAYVLEWNRENARREERVAGATTPATPATTLTQTALPGAGMMGMQGMGMMGMQPGMGMGMGMQPGMGMGMQPGMGMDGGMGMQPGMPPGMGGMQPGMQPGMMQPGMQPGMPAQQPMI